MASLEEVRRLIERAWERAGQQEAPPPQTRRDRSNSLSVAAVRGLMRAGALDLWQGVVAVVPGVGDLRWPLRRGADEGPEIIRLPDRPVDLDEPAHEPRIGRRSAALLSLAVLVAVVAVPLTGNSEEAIALTGELLFDVPALPEDALGLPAERSRVLDVNGNLIAILSGPENRRVVDLDQVPEVLQQAVIATEDTRFFQHEGVDARAIFRAALANFQERGVAEGASTITQQYVKNALLTSETSFRRKVTEATWAVRLEESASKQDILEGYLNVVYLGGGTYGVAAAAEHWFGMEVAELDLSRSALLASMIRAPSNLDLANEPEAARPGRDVVLAEMVRVGFITPDEAEAARAPAIEDLLDITPLPGPAAPMYVRHVVDAMLADPALGEDREARANAIFTGGLTIRTTLDPGMQVAAQDAVASHVSDPTVDPMAGIVSVEPGTGAIRAMALGPHGWGPCTTAAAEQPCSTTAVNPLVGGSGSPGRQVGSAFKPIVMAAALEQGFDTTWHTNTAGGIPVRGCPDDWRPQNYSGGSSGYIDAVEAMRTSNNVFHVKLGLAVGLENVAATAAALGLGELPPWCSLPLGSIEGHPVELAGAYAAFAAEGLWCRPHVVAEVTSRDGESLVAPEPACRQAISPETAATVTAMLEQVMVRGTATRAQIGRPAAGKTGTTDDYRDAWLVGVTPQLATAVWVGHEIPKPMEDTLGWRRVAGGTVPAMIWAAYMHQALAPHEALPLAMSPLARWDGNCVGADLDLFEEGDQRCAPPKPEKDDDKGKRKGKDKKRDRDDD